MDTAGCFNDTLAAITWDRINIFLPQLRNEIYPPQLPSEVETQTPQTNVTQSFQEPKPAQNLQESSSEATNDQTNTSIPPSSIQQPTISQHQVFVQNLQPLPQSMQIPSPLPAEQQISHSPPTFISMENQPANLKYPPFSRTFAIPGSSVIAPPTSESLPMNVPFSVSSNQAYFPQPAPSYPWPAPGGDPKGYSQV